MFSFFSYSWFVLDWRHLYRWLSWSDYHVSIFQIKRRVGLNLLTAAGTICKCSGREHRENVHSEH